jgi:Phospholipase_D-nuclease N-terminal
LPPIWFDWGEMKLLIEILLAIILHPIAFILCLINILGRGDLNVLQKVVWIVVTLIWGIGPILYLLVGSGKMW